MAILPMRNATLIVLGVVAVIVIFALIAQPRGGTSHIQYYANRDVFAAYNATHPKYSQLRLMAMLLDTQGYSLFETVADQDLTQGVIRNSDAYVPMCGFLTAFGANCCCRL